LEKKLMTFVSRCRQRASSLIERILSGDLTRPDVWEERFGVRRTALALAFAAELFSFFLNSTVHIHFHSYLRFIDIADAPFAPVKSRDLPFQEYRLRMLGPTVAYLLGLHGLIATIVPLLAAVPLYFCVYRAMRRRVSAGTATAALFLLATTLVTMSSRMILGFQDTLASFGISICIYYRYYVIMCIAMFLGMFADERAAAAIPLILLWHLLERRGHVGNNSLGHHFVSEPGTSL
jgi:hypothetical protein